MLFVVVNTTSRWVRISGFKDKMHHHTCSHLCQPREISKKAGFTRVIERLTWFVQAGSRLILAFGLKMNSRYLSSSRRSRDFTALLARMPRRPRFVVK